VEIVGATIGVIGTILAIVLWWLRRKKPKTKLDVATDEISKRRAAISRLRFLNQRRKTDEIENELDRQDRELAALDVVRRKRDKADGDEGD